MDRKRHCTNVVRWSWAICLLTACGRTSPCGYPTSFLNIVIGIHLHNILCYERVRLQNVRLSKPTEHKAFAFSGVLPVCHCTSERHTPGFT